MDLYARSGSAVVVMVTGDIAMGAQRWLDLGIVRFQPSEIMKLAVPLACAWYLHERPLPPSFLSLVDPRSRPSSSHAADRRAAGPRHLAARRGRRRHGRSCLQDCSCATSSVDRRCSIPVAFVAWQFLLHDYQRQRVLTFLDPQSDPLGAGYHIIQSQIAIGSGGVFGKGYLSGSQAQLEFLPERSTDFIFAVIGEEWGLIGLVTVILLYMFVIGRALYLAATAQDTFARLAAGSLALTFCVYVFVNTGMVKGCCLSSACRCR